MQPRFITLEGGEGAGKSTQLKRLSAAFAAKGIPHITTREPGGSVGAEAIRQLLVTGAVDRWDATTESLLFMTARYDHIHRTIKPALARGEWVLCDRFFDSTYVYQGIAKGVDGAWLKQLYQLLYGNFGPDMTLLLDIPPEEGLKRTTARAGNETRFEQMDIGFHERLRAGFLALAKAEPTRIRRIDAAGDADTVHATLITQINSTFSLALVPQST
jgi:dTMP kinase